MVAVRNIAFFREVAYLVEGVDLNLTVDYVFGLPMMGWARHSPVMQQRASRPSRCERPSKEEAAAAAAANMVALERARPSRDPRADLLSLEKTEAKLECHTMIGHLYGLGEVPRGDPILLNSFVCCFELHGGAIEDSCWNIDDGNARGHNFNTPSTSTHRPADLD